VIRIVGALSVGLAAALVLSIAGTGVAQASRPAQPAFTKGGEAISTALKIEGASEQPRFLIPSLDAAIRCEKSESSGEIEKKGRDKGKIIYKGCSISELKESKPKESSEETKEIVEGEGITKCKVNSTEASAGEIKITGLKSRLVWAKGENVILDHYEGEKEPLVELTVEGEGCLLKGKYKVEGSLLAAVPDLNEESISNPQYFEATDEGDSIKRTYTKFEVEEESKKTEGTAELNTAGKAVILESAEQVELAAPEGEKHREPFGVHE
jgi:hypothetical protein